MTALKVDLQGKAARLKWRDTSLLSNRDDTELATSAKDKVSKRHSNSSSGWPRDPRRFPMNRCLGRLDV